MGFTLYVVADDGDYVSFGKELELSHCEAVAMLRFIFDKDEFSKDIYILRFGLHENIERIMKKDVSKEYLDDVKQDFNYMGVGTRQS